MTADNRSHRWARGVALVAACLTACSLAAACGDDDEPSSGELRDAGMRLLPGRVTPDPWRPDASASGLVDDFFGPFDAGPCCAVDFALVAEAGEVAAVLRGTEAPLSSPDGVAMRYQAGAWTGSVCLPPQYTGLYYYEVYALPDTDGDGGVADATEAPESGADPLPPEVLEAAGLFRSHRHNGAVLTEADPVLGVVNIFGPADACGDAGAGHHGQLAAPAADSDAGN